MLDPLGTWEEFGTFLKEHEQEEREMSCTACVWNALAKSRQWGCLQGKPCHPVNTIDLEQNHCKAWIPLPLS